MRKVDYYEEGCDVAVIYQQYCAIALTVEQICQPNESELGNFYGSPKHPFLTGPCSVMNEIPRSLGGQYQRVISQRHPSVTSKAFSGFARE